MELFLRNFVDLEKDDAMIAGGKGASLGEMTRAGIPVPLGFVILSSAFEKFLEETDLNVEIDSIFHSVNHKEIHTIENASEKIKSLILQAEMPKDIAMEIQKFFKNLNSKYVAVRSSATAEDSASAAWAGQLESYLNTTEENLLENVKKCWASLFTPRAIFYRFEKGLHNQKISVAVVVQKMVESEKSGIAFSVHPVTQDRNQLIIEAGFGLGEAIVSGQITPDSYVVEKQPRRIIDKNVHVQSRGLYRAENGGNEWRNIPKEQGEKQVLSDKEILELSEIILKIENHYNLPCDIEWAFEKRKFYIVQSRPITTLYKNIPLPKKLQKIVSRFYYPITIQAWFNGATKELRKVIDAGFSDVIVKFDGKKVEVFRIAEELHSQVKEAMLRYIKTDKFYDGVKNYELLVLKYDKLLGTDKNDIQGAVKCFEKLYPLFAISYFISNLWIDEVRENKEKVIELCKKYRELSDGILNKLDQFVANYLQSKNLPLFTTLELLNTGNVERETKWMKLGYVFSKGKFYNIPWDKFLLQNNFTYQEEQPEIIKGEIKGNTAFPGVVIGKVKIVFSPLDFRKIKNGDILVSSMTQPTFAPILSKISAIVTDEGGITCHAAIVAREMKKPCIIGTKIATTLLKDGDKIEVDATTGVVRIVK